jgi:hypothetical protein
MVIILKDNPVWLVAVQKCLIQNEVGQSEV